MSTAIDRIRAKNASSKPVATIEAASIAATPPRELRAEPREQVATTLADSPVAADRLPGPANLPPPIACPICECPAVWSSIYDPDAYRCCDCDPAPAAALIARRWLIVDWGFGDGSEWEDFRPETGPWKPKVDTKPKLELKADTRVGIDPETGRPFVQHLGKAVVTSMADAPGTLRDTTGLGDIDDIETAYDRAAANHHDPLWRLDPVGVRVGTLVDHPVPAAVRCDDGRLLTVFASGWNTLARLTVRHGFDEAWRILGMRD